MYYNVILVKISHKFLFDNLHLIICNKQNQYFHRDEHIIFRWDDLNEHISRNKIDNCFYCGNICTSPYVYSAKLLKPIFELAVTVIKETSEWPVVLCELYYCFPECRKDYW